MSLNEYIKKHLKFVKKKKKVFKSLVRKMLSSKNTKDIY